MSRCDDPGCIACVWAGVDDQVWLDHGAPQCVEHYVRRNARDFIMENEDERQED